MKLDKDICLGGRFNDLNVTGIKFNNMVIYPYGWVDPGVLNTYKIVITGRDLIEEPYGPMYLYLQRLPYPEGINDWRIGTYINWGDGSIFEYGYPGEIPSKHHYNEEGTYILKTNWYPYIPSNNDSYNRNNQYYNPNYPPIIEEEGNSTSNYIITEANVLRTLTDMSGICSYFRALIYANINVTSDTTKVNSMFFGCRSLKLVNTAEWDTSRMKNMANLFWNCKSLTELYLNNWDTSKVTDMRGMLYGCKSLVELDLSNWDTRSIQYMDGMFLNCESLRSLNLSNFDLSGLDEELCYMGYGISAMFSGCKSLEYVQFGKNFCTSKITNIESMFEECESLLTLDLNNWNVSNIDYAPYVFKGCRSLVQLNLSNWKTHYSISTREMFCDCESLQELDLSNFNMTEDNYTGGMFKNCNSLHTLKLNNCNSSTISNIINSTDFPKTRILDSEGNKIPRKIYCKQANVAGLTAPTNWQFEYVDEDAQ